MSTQKTRNALALATLLAASTLTSPAIAGPSAQHLSAASTHSAAASVHAGTAVVKGVAAVAATPLIAVGASGMASAVAGSELHKYANEPLRVGHEVLHSNPGNSSGTVGTKTINKPTTPNPAEQMANPKPENR